MDAPGMGRPSARTTPDCFIPGSDTGWAASVPASSSTTNQRRMVSPLLRPLGRKFSFAFPHAASEFDRVAGNFTLLHNLAGLSAEFDRLRERDVVTLNFALLN